jgi:3-hydroxypropanoate dehydrogenase
MAAPLDDKALDQLFREARSYNGWLDEDVSESRFTRSTN